MRAILDCKTHHTLDQAMRKAHGYNGYQLMDLATDRLMDMLKDILKNKRTVVVCGPGDNGGDGYALAKKGKSIGLTMDIFNTNTAVHRSTQATQLFYRQAKASGANMVETTVDFNRYDVIIDCLFGSGLNRPLSDRYACLVETINQSTAQIISIDLPSGLSGDHYSNDFPCIEADLTLTIGGYKPVMVNGSARKKCGQIRLIPLWEDSMWHGLTNDYVVETNDLSSYLPSRKSHSHKGSYGKGLLIGGSRSMGGAIVLAAKAALHSGMGTTTVMVPSCIESRMGVSCPEVMILTQHQDDQGFMDGPLDIHDLHPFDVISIGNGLGVTSNASRMVQTILQTDKPIIIDGDGLNVLQDHLDLLKRDGWTILTPHLKEMARLIQKDIEYISEHPFEVLDDFKKRYPNVTVLLKDDWMYTSDGTNHVVIPLGNNGLAKGGSGDVLCGLTISMMAQCHDPMRSVIASAMLLGLSSQVCAKQYTPYCMVATDLIDALPSVIRPLYTMI